jgi:hypothetical protein
MFLRPTNLRRNLLLALLICGLLLCWVLFQWPCVIRTVLGIPCPGCGLSRAWLAALRLDLSAAFSYHPLFWTIPLLGLYMLWDGKLFKNPWLNKLFPAVALGAYLLCYGIRLVAYLRGEFSF